MFKRWEAWPTRTRWLIGITAAVVLVAVIAWALFIPLADWLARHDVGSAKPALLQTARDAARGRLLTLGAGLVAGGALVFTALNFTLLRRNSEQTHDWQRQADEWQRRTHELAERGQVTDRFTKAIEQLGSDKLDVRIGGIYALERVARDSAQDHPTVMEVLTAFIREHSRVPLPPPDREHSREPLPPPHTHNPEERFWWIRPDVQAAVTVIGRRDAKRDLRRIDLTGAIWREVHGANLAGARLVGADLADADLRDAKLNDAHLTGADLHGADLRDANLSSAHLTGVDLGGASLRDADLRGAHLTGVDLTGVVDLTFAMWPEGVQVPDGWMIDSGSGRLERAGELSEVTAHCL